MRVIAAVLTAAALLPSISTATAAESPRPIIGCDDQRYTFSNHWDWAVAPTGMCTTGGTLGTTEGIDHARWTGWGNAVAHATGYLVDGLGFEYAATITAHGLASCTNCGAGPGTVRWYKSLHVVSSGGVRGGVQRGPFNLTIDVTPQERITTLGVFVRQPYSIRIAFAIGYLTTHPSACYDGKPTPLRVAENVAPAVAGFTPGYDAGDGSTVPASTPIGKAIAHAIANIGC